jgi:hypothetical protein
VLEKEGKIKEGMKMMGLSNAAFYLSWYVRGFDSIRFECVLFNRMPTILPARAFIFFRFATTFVQFFVLSVVMAVVARNGSNNAIFIYSEGTMVFLFFFVFCLSIITLCWWV